MGGGKPIRLAALTLGFSPCSTMNTVRAQGRLLNLSTLGLWSAIHSLIHSRNHSSIQQYLSCSY